jgi:hypothetical protein
MPFKPHPGSRPGHKPLMTKAGREIAEAIFNAADQRIRRFVVGQNTPPVHGQLLRIDAYAWRAAGRYPRPDEIVRIDQVRSDGRLRDVIVGTVGQKLSLTVLRRQGHVIEDPAFGNGTVLMLSERARTYVAMREKRAARAKRRAAWRAKHQITYLSQM